MDYFDICDKETVPSVHELLSWLITCPVTSVSVERMFSTVKRNHTPQRRRMTEKRLFDLCILSFEREYTNEIRKKPEIIIRMLKGNNKK